MFRRVTYELAQTLGRNGISSGGLERRNTTSFGALLAFAAMIAPARAEPGGRLSYERQSGAEFCPDEVALRRAVVARLGEDPFTADGSRTFRLTLRASEGRLRGTIELEASGVVEGRRELDAGANACAELVEALALAVSLTINPNLVVDGAGTPASIEPAPVEPEPPAALPPPPATSFRPPPPSPPRNRPTARSTSTERAPVTLAAGAAAHFAVGTGPGIAAGGSAIVRAEGKLWRVGLEGRVDTFSQADIGRNGTVYSTLIAGVLAPCARVGQVSACPLLLLGSLYAESEGVTTERSDRGFFSAAGARLSTGIPLGEHLLLELRMDALYALSRVTIELDGNPVWRAGASGTFGAGLIWTFP